MIEAHTMPDLGMKLVPYRGEDVVRRAAEWLRKPAAARWFGTVRCMPATHLRGLALPKRNVYEPPRRIGFLAEWRARVAQTEMDSQLAFSVDLMNFARHVGP